MSFVATSPLFDDVAVEVAMVNAGSERQKEALAWAEQVLGDRCAQAELIDGDVDGALRAEVERTGADMVIMGAYGHSPLRSMIVGSTTTTMIRRLTFPVLLFR